MMRKGMCSLALCVAAILMMASLGCQQASSPTTSKSKAPEAKPNKQPKPDPG